jgi:hypothetical protein
LRLIVLLPGHDDSMDQGGVGCHRTGGYPAPGDQKPLGVSSMICAVRPRHRPLLVGCGGAFAAACVLAACGTSPDHPAAAPTTTTSSTTTTTTAAPTTTTTLPAGVGVPNVVGMKIDLARFYLRTAGFTTVALNVPCNKGTMPSQSVVASLSVPGKPPDMTVGAQPLAPGTLLPKASRVGITWSGCYPTGTTVPLVTGHTFFSAVHLLHAAGLAWACYAVGDPTTTTTHPRTTRTLPVTTGTADPRSATTTTVPPATETAAHAPTTVLTQGTKAGTVVPAGAVVALVMHHCPQ